MKNRETESSSYLAVVAIAVAAAVIAATAVTCIYHSQFAQEIKVVDLKGYLRSQAALLSAGEISKDQWQDNLDALGKRLQSEPANHVVLLKEVVLRNGEELPIK